MALSPDPRRGMVSGIVGITAEPQAPCAFKQAPFCLSGCSQEPGVKKVSSPPRLHGVALHTQDTGNSLSHRPNQVPALGLWFYHILSAAL